MPIRQIAVHVDDTPEAADRVLLAARLARRHDATLLGLSALRPPPPLVIEGAVVDPWPGEIGLKQVRETLAARHLRFREISSEAPRVVWRAEVEDANRFVLDETAGSDLIVLGREAVTGDFFCLDPAAVVSAAGRPVLYAGKGLTNPPSAHALIAWKDSREARRAVGDALPVLATMERVSLVSAAPDDEAEARRASLSHVAAFLDRHGIGCHVHLVPCRSGAEIAAIAEEIRRTEPDLVVAGAFGHSRFGEWIFGGMTRYLLDKTGLCCLLSH
jgi:nucleotide-binding universal stress UspA family protein